MNAFQKKQFFSISLCIAFATLLLCSCRNIDLFEKNTVLPKYEWKAGFAATGSFIITDTATAYNIYVVLRHTDAYNYNNIWLNIGFQSPGDSMKFQKLDLSLGNDVQGWEGAGMNDIWEVRKLIMRLPNVKKTGEYRFSIGQVMRDNPLLHVMSAGLRLEKSS